MFTGIVEELGVVERIEESKTPCVFTIRAKTILEGLKKGDSVSVNGVCLTAVGIEKDRFAVDVIKETLMMDSNFKGLFSGRDRYLGGLWNALETS